MKKEDSLENSFLEAFGQSIDAPGGQYLYRDQKDIVRDYNRNKNVEKSNEVSEIYRNELEEHTQVGTSKDTGERFEINVKTFKPKDDREREWIEREMMVSFTSLDDESKKVVSTLSGLCRGKYASYKSLPANEVADHLSKECDFVFKYAEASMAIYSDIIDAKQAFRIAKSIAEKNIISNIDYEKIQSKLLPTACSEFDRLLGDARICVAYPVDDNIKTADAKDVDYYINYIKDLKEYRLGDTDGLRNRVASILAQSDQDTRVGLILQIKKDASLKNII